MSRSFKIAIIGPESTGKSELSIKLSNHYNGVYYPEIARDYVAKLNHKYTVQDIDSILELQINQYKEALNDKNRFHFFDTEWIITKIWYEWVYNVLPIDFKDVINSLNYDFYLLCAPDIVWVPDSVRENGGDARQQLFEIYEQELKFFNEKYCVVQGFGDDRTKCAIDSINRFLKV